MPVQLIISFRARALKHVYWEARFDAEQPQADWRRVREVVEPVAIPDCDDLIERIVERTLFSFRTNKRIFNSVMALHRVEQWQRLMSRVGHPLALSADRTPRSSASTSSAATPSLDMLQRRHADARCVALDPTGRESARARRGASGSACARSVAAAQLTPALHEAILAEVVPELAGDDSIV